MTDARIFSARTADDLMAVRRLFADYAATLPVDLGYQDFAAELSALPGKYAPPAGALFLARGRHDEPVGCVALRPLDDPRVCEMKRLYLAPSVRAQGLGRALAETVIAAARRIGYAELRLDTLSSMDAARGLYARLGFVEIPPYYAPTPDGTVFLSLALQA